MNPSVTTNAHTIAMRTLGLNDCFLESEVLFAVLLFEVVFDFVGVEDAMGSL
jgi:hypothetical protein